MPAAQTLLLFAREIDTNETLSILICDQWLALEFPVPDSGQALLMRAIKLRNKWEFLLSERLKDSTVTGTTRTQVKHDFDRIEEDLAQGLVDYMRTTVPYTIKRLLPADLKSMYVGPDQNDTWCVDPNPFQPDFTVVRNKTKGGVRVTSNVTFDCVKETEWSEKLRIEMLQTEWHCQRCPFEGKPSTLEKMQHQEVTCCEKSSATETEKTSSTPPPAQRRRNTPNTKTYDCPDCARTFYLTPIEILKHKKLHSV